MSLVLDAGALIAIERGDREVAAVIVAARQDHRSVIVPYCDSGFKTTFVKHCGGAHISAEAVKRIHAGVFEVLPRRWVVERTWSWLMNNRRLQVDYERDPRVSEGFVWAAHCRMLLRRLTELRPS